ncbi:hypothetical protein AB3S75_040483 [Citrus x aurantiifolia]
MDYLKVSGGKASPKRELRPSKNRQQQRTMMSSVMEAIAQVNGGGGGNNNIVSETSNEDNGVVRMKIRVTKQDLKQMLQVMNTNTNGAHYSQIPAGNSPLTASSVEQRLNRLRRKHILRAVNPGKENRLRSWRPVLQSIPKEL